MSANLERVELPAGLQVIAGTSVPAILEGRWEPFQVLHALLSRRFGADEPEHAQVGTADNSAELAGLVPGASHGDQSPIWTLHSGGDRYDRPDWGRHDLDLAIRALDRFSPKARQLLHVMTTQPGVLTSSADLAPTLNVPGSHGIAGVLSGFVQGCEEVNRAFPLRWFERPGTPTLYGVRPAVAQLFVEAFVRRGVEPIRARHDQRWYGEIIPATVQILAAQARREQPIRYRELTERVREAVPAARVPHRGRVIGWLLEDVATKIHELNPALPALTSLVIGPDGQPSTGFLPLLRRLRGDVVGRLPEVAKREQQACAATYSEQVTADLIARLRTSVP
jgi:hypothetical protein